MNALAYSTNSLTTTPDDLSVISSGVGAIRKPRIERRPFSRLTSPASEKRAVEARLAEIKASRVPNVAVEPEHTCTKACYVLVN